MVEEVEKRDTTTTATAVDTLRLSVRRSHPEIDRLYSDAYIGAVLSVPNRTYEYARDEKIIGALEWRRSFDVDALVGAFRCDEGAGGVFRLVDSGPKNGSFFDPSQSLVDICLSGAFSLAGFDNEGRAVLRSKAALLDWWKTGVEDGIRYHVLVIEHALRVISENRNKDNDTRGGDNESIPESMVLYVDTSDLGYIPPPLGALTGMAKLLQRAYPDRIHRIHVGPVNAVLMKLYEFISPYLRPRSREKISLMECAPNKETIGALESQNIQDEGTEEVSATLAK
mmetsp:Transcript_8152/g.17613  ORF Transcript_8152/g.17613 Transcript_8152/m.17613 type:complete len:283 (+) Transcript_8152:85-933(+)